MGAQVGLFDKWSAGGGAYYGQDLYYTPEQFGAVGGGVNDSAAFNRLFAAVLIDPKPIFLGPKVYWVSNLAISLDGLTIEGSGKSSVLRLIAGSTHLLRILNSHSVNLKNFSYHMNSVANADGIHHLGGYYHNYKNLWVDKSTVDATSNSLKIESNAPPGLGAYVNHYENLTQQRVYVKGLPTNHVTTCTFVNLDSSYVIAEYADALTFLQPVIQEDGGYHFDLNVVDGLTNLGGDFEGNGVLYYFRLSCQHIKSIGNAMGGFSGTYLTVAGGGNEPADSLFLDNYFGTLGYQNMWLGALSGQVFKNTGWNVKSRQGYFYAGNIFQLCFNCKPISATSVNLDDTGEGGIVISLKNGAAVLEAATAGANPRNLAALVWT